LAQCQEFTIDSGSSWQGVHVALVVPV